MTGQNPQSVMTSGFALISFGVGAVRVRVFRSPALLFAEMLLAFVLFFFIALTLPRRTGRASVDGIGAEGSLREVERTVDDIVVFS